MPWPLRAYTQCLQGLMVIDLALELHRRAKAQRSDREIRRARVTWQDFAMAGDTLRAKASGAQASIFVASLPSDAQP